MSEITNHEATLLEQFNDHLKDEGLTEQTRDSYLSYIRTVMRTTDQFDPAEGPELEDELRDVVEKLHERDLSKSSRSSYRRVIERFWKWRTGEAAPEVLHTLDASTTDEVDDLTANIRPADEIEQLIRNIRNPQVQAFVAMVFLTGARPKECLELQRQDVRLTDDQLTVDLANTDRTVTLDQSADSTPTKSMLMVRRWHTSRDESEPTDSYWTSDGTSEELSYQSVTYQLRKLSDEYSVDNRLTLTKVRQSRIADYISLSENSTEADVRSRFGFSEDSTMPQRYFEVVADADFLGSSPIECPQCGLISNGDRITCRECYFPIGVVDDESATLADISMRDLLRTVSELEAKLDE